MTTRCHCSPMIRSRRVSSQVHCNFARSTFSSLRGSGYDRTLPTPTRNTSSHWSVSSVSHLLVRPTSSIRCVNNVIPCLSVSVIVSTVLMDPCGLTGLSVGSLSFYPRLFSINIYKFRIVHCHHSICCTYMCIFINTTEKHHSYELLYIAIFEKDI